MQQQQRQQSRDVTRTARGLIFFAAFIILTIVELTCVVGSTSSTSVSVVREGTYVKWPQRITSEVSKNFLVKTEAAVL